MRAAGPARRFVESAENQCYLGIRRPERRRALCACPVGLALSWTGMIFDLCA